MRRIDYLLTEIRHRREMRAAQLQGLIEPPAEFDPIEDRLALYRLIRELRSISTAMDKSEQILEIDRLIRARQNFLSHGTDRTFETGLMDNRITSNLHRLTTYAAGRFGNPTYVASMRSAIEDATVYAYIFELVEHAFILLDEWDRKRLVEPRRIDRIKARSAPQSVPLANRPAAEKPAKSSADVVIKSTIQVEPEVLDRYIGSYKETDSPVLSITRNAKQLIAQVTGDEPVPLYARSRTEFFSRIAKLEFQVNEHGPSDWMILHYAGHDYLLMRIDAPASRDTATEQL